MRADSQGTDREMDFAEEHDEAADERPQGRDEDDADDVRDVCRETGST